MVNQSLLINDPATTLCGIRKWRRGRT